MNNNLRIAEGSDGTLDRLTLDRLLTRRSILTAGVAMAASGLAFPLLAACSGSSTASSGTTSGTQTFGPAKYTWKFPTPNSTDTPAFKAYQYLAQRILQHTNGAVNVQLYPNGQFGGQPEAYKGVQSGQFEITGVDASVVIADVPSAVMVQLPYVYKSPESATKVWKDPKIMTPISAAIEARGLHVLGWFNLGVRQMGGSKLFVHPTDLVGTKIRVLASDLFLTFYQALHAVPVSLAPTEVYTALQQGIVSAYDIPISNILGAQVV